MYAGKVPGYIGAGECISCPTVEGYAAGGDNHVHPSHSPTFVHDVGVRKLSHEVASRPVLGGLLIHFT